MRNFKFFTIIISLFLLLSLCGCKGCSCAPNSCNHDFSDWQIVEGSLCDGCTKERTCKDCGESESKSFSGVGHNFITEEKVDATCLADGYELSVCSNCGLENNNTIQKLSHDYQFTSKNYESCGQNYVNKYTCSICFGEKFEQDEEIAQHIYEEAEYVAPTCTEDGVRVEICKNCQDSKSETLEKTNHSMKTKTEEPTCHKVGSAISYCENSGCSYSETLDNLPKIPHEMTILGSTYYSYDGLSVYSDLSCSVLVADSQCYRFDGIDKHFVCNSADCGLEVELKSHDFKTKNTATCTKDGELISLCENCGKIESKTFQQALGHDDIGVVFTCKPDNQLTLEYRGLTGDENGEVCYKCSVCSEYILTTAHNPSRTRDEITCINPQYCLDCETIMASVDHVYPQVTCISSKGDEYFYCESCKITPLGRLTAHNSGENQFLCKVNEALSEEYFITYGEKKNIAFKCNDCNNLIEATAHVKSCEDSEITCYNPQLCKECSSLIKKADHVAPEFKCVSIHDDDYYYCVVCCYYPMGKTIPHNYAFAVDTIKATCTANEKRLNVCECGMYDEEGYVEVKGTMLGHKISKFVFNDVSDCGKGHAIISTIPYCQNAGCDLNFAMLTNEDDMAYCLSVYNYFNAKRALDDKLYDANLGRAGNEMVKSLLTCCSSTNYRYYPVEHEYGEIPYTTEDYIINGETYSYVPSTCFVKGSAVRQCEKCYQLAYAENVLPLNPYLHESDVLPCEEHCNDCVPEGKLCNLYMEIVVYDQNGKFIVSEVLNGEFLISRVEEISIDGKVAYRFTEAYVSVLEGLEYFTTQEAANDQNYKYEMDWEKVVLHLSAENKFVVYKRV